jgi:DNA invertase Pin-like site-specific DNA recombinase
MRPQGRNERGQVTADQLLNSVQASTQVKCTTLPIGVYLRISKDDEGDAAGVNRQKTDAIILAARLGIPESRLVFYIDNDTSAFKRGVVREDFERLLKDLAGRVIGGALAYDLDRLVRKPKDLERLIDIYDELPGLLSGFVTIDLDLAQPNQRAMARILVSLAYDQSAAAARRQKRKAIANAIEGKKPGGTTAFGWLDDGYKVDPEAVALIKVGYDLLLRGCKFATIGRAWAKLGRTRPNGLPLTSSWIKAIYRNPRIAGLSTYKGDAVKTSEGEFIRGDWEAILTVEEWDAACAAIRDLERPDPIRAATRGLLSAGIARCGVCDKPLRSLTRTYDTKAGPKSQRRYGCDSSNDGGCGKIMRSAEPIDQLVTAYVFAEAAKNSGATPQERAEVPEPPRLAEIAEERTILVAHKKTMSYATYLDELEALDAEATALRVEHHRQVGEAVIAAKVDPTALAGRWEGMPLEEKRAAIMDYVRAVVVKPINNTSRVFNTEAIEIVPRYSTM